jgi:hypothetical protein
MDPDEMRQHANRYRDITRMITDAHTIRALTDLADEYEALADKTQPREANSQSDEQR